MTLVAILTVRRAALDTFRAFEAQAAAIMATHDGRIERTVVVDTDPTGAVLKEIHVVTFPSAAAFAAYRSDPRLAALASQRDAAVVHADVLVGEDGPRYGP